LTKLYKTSQFSQWNLTIDSIPDLFVEKCRDFSFALIESANDFGHNIEHLIHVKNLSELIINKEFSDISPDVKRIAIICAYMHENGDAKLKAINNGYEKSRDFINQICTSEQYQYGTDLANYIYNIIKQIGISKATKRKHENIVNLYVNTVEFCVASDADILAQTGAFLMIRGAQICAQKKYTIMNPTIVNDLLPNSVFKFEKNSHDKYNYVLKMADRVDDVEEFIRTNVAKEIFQKNKKTTEIIKLALLEEFANI
jgi:rhodanese-related sulfurtransferase